MLCLRSLGFVMVAPILALATLSTGCANAHATKPANDAASSSQASTTSLTAGEMPAKQTEELPPMVAVNSSSRGAHPKESEARLIVDQSIVLRCPNVQEMASAQFEGPPAEAWVAILAAVTRCMNDGELGASHLRVIGSMQGVNAVGYVLTRLGADTTRLEAVDSFEEDLCSGDRTCAVTTIRIDLSDPTDEGTHI